MLEVTNLKSGPGGNGGLCGGKKRKRRVPVHYFSFVSNCISSHRWRFFPFSYFHFFFLSPNKISVRSMQLTAPLRSVNLVENRFERSLFRLLFLLCGVIVAAGAALLLSLFGGLCVFTRLIHSGAYTMVVITRRLFTDCALYAVREFYTLIRICKHG